MFYRVDRGRSSAPPSAAERHNALFETSSRIGAPVAPLVLDQRVQITVGEAFAAAEEGQLDEEARADDHAAELTDEAVDRLHRAAGCEDVVAPLVPGISDADASGLDPPKMLDAVSQPASKGAAKPTSTTSAFALIARCIEAVIKLATMTTPSALPTPAAIRPALVLTSPRALYAGTPPLPDSLGHFTKPRPDASDPSPPGFDGFAPSPYLLMWKMVLAQHNCRNLATVVDLFISLRTA